MNSVKLLPLSIFVEIADAVKVNFEGFKNVASSTGRGGGRVKGVTGVVFSLFDCLFIPSVG